MKNVSDYYRYSDKYADDTYEYRHVFVPSDKLKEIPRHRLMEEKEWRELGVQQSRGWVHYALWEKEPNLLLFRRKLAKPDTEKDE